MPGVWLLTGLTGRAIYYDEWVDRAEHGASLRSCHLLAFSLDSDLQKWGGRRPGSLGPTTEPIRMTIEARQILENALALPAIERAAIVESLLSSLDQPDARIDDVWAEEAERRIAAYEAGQMKAIPADEVFRELGYRKVQV